MFFWTIESISLYNNTSLALKENQNYFFDIKFSEKYNLAFSY